MLLQLAYRPSTCEVTGMTLTSMVLRRELFLLCDLLFGATPDKEQPMTDNMTNFMTPIIMPVHI
jgi:hypothetical protein